MSSSSSFVNIKLCKETGMCIIRSLAPNTPEKDFVRPVDYNVFERTCIPSEYRLRAGALVSLMLHYPKRTVSLIELRAFDNGPLWMAEAQIDEEYEEGQDVYRRGVGATPVDALASLAIDIQLY